jgi:hypothetical protein
MRSNQDSSTVIQAEIADNVRASHNSRRLIAAMRIGKEEAMSGTGLAAVLLMIGIVMLVMCFWKQIAIFLLFVAVTVFCLGVYYIVSMIGSYVS